MKGLFVSFEGTDGCGKSTQIRMVAEELTKRGYEVVLSREPGGCPISERIRELLLDVRAEQMTDICEALLFAAARAQHVRETILPALKRGAIVLCDRFLDSSLAYQGVARGLGMDLVRKINAPAIDGCMPDLTIFLNLDPAESMKRRSSATELDRIEKAPPEFMIQVYQTLSELSRTEPERVASIDASGTPEQVFAAIMKVVDSKLAS